MTELEDNRYAKLEQEIESLNDRLELEELAADTASKDICYYRKLYHEQKNEVLSIERKMLERAAEIVDAALGYNHTGSIIGDLIRKEIK